MTIENRSIEKRKEVVKRENAKEMYSTYVQTGRILKAKAVEPEMLPPSAYEKLIQKQINAAR